MHILDMPILCMPILHTPSYRVIIGLTGIGEAIMVIAQATLILAIGITLPGIIQGIGDTIAGDMVVGKVSAGNRLTR